METAMHGDSVDSERGLVDIADPAVAIGSLEGAPQYTFEWVSDVDVLATGGIVVVDNRGARVARYGPSGTWRDDIGSRGGGPGEYRLPLQAVVSETGGMTEIKERQHPGVPE